MDRITKQLLKDFLKTQELHETDEPADFEKFCNYSVISNEYGKTFTIENVAVGNGNDTGLDGIGIIVNGNLIEEVDEINDLLERNNTLDVTYVFIQAKTSSNFDTKEMHAFYFGINDFFSEAPKLPRNEDIEKHASISDNLLKHASYFSENPKCKTFYITTGVYNPEDKNIVAVLANADQTLKSHNLFSKVELNVLGASELGKLYRKTTSPIEADFIFQHKVTLPTIEGVNQAYYGIIPFSEYRKIIIDENDNIKNVFDDNVRDFQGLNNNVNKNISETLASDRANLFSVLNNGVTIVSDSIKTLGNNFTIYDYQIVNGCQTSHVLYECRNNKNVEDIIVPVRLIVTSDEDIKSKITVSTNNQTAIKKEQLSAMSEFQKNLEHYYNSIDGDNRLFYERRAKQYNSNRMVSKRRIVTIPNQIKAFSSMFNKNPHHVTSYFGSLAKNIGSKNSKIFEPDHHYSSYYLSGLALYKLENLFLNKEIDLKYRKVKFYLLMLIPLIASNEEIPPLNSSKKTERFCNEIIKKLTDEASCKQIFQAAATVIDKSNAKIGDKQALKSKAMTEQILNAYSEIKIKV